MGTIEFKYIVKVYVNNNSLELFMNLKELSSLKKCIQKKRLYSHYSKNNLLIINAANISHIEVVEKKDEN